MTDKQELEVALIYKNGAFVPYDQFQDQECSSRFVDGQPYIFKVEAMRASSKRTWLQNRAMHLYLKMLADALNDAGVDMKSVLNHMKGGFSVMCTMERLKENVWKPMQEAMFQVKSTTKLDTDQVCKVYENVNIFTAREFGVSIPFPDRFGQMYESMKDDYGT